MIILLTATAALAVVAVAATVAARRADRLGSDMMSVTQLAGTAAILIVTIADAWLESDRSGLIVR